MEQIIGGRHLKADRAIPGQPYDIMLLAIAGGFITHFAERPASDLVPLIFASVIWVFAQEAGLVSRLLQTTPFVRLGGVVLFYLYGPSACCAHPAGVSGCGTHANRDRG